MNTTPQDSPAPDAAPAPRDYEPYCFVCSRCTDHFGEHDALVSFGLAEYDGDYVLKTDKWDDDLAREIADREYVEMYPDAISARDPQAAEKLAAAMRAALV